MKFEDTPFQLAKKAKKCGDITKLFFKTPNRNLLEYYIKEEDLRRRILKAGQIGQKFIFKGHLTDVLDRFKLLPEDDDEYEPVWGSFHNVMEVYSYVYGYPVQYPDPAKALNANEWDTIDGAFLSVYYKHRTMNNCAFTAHYALYVLNDNRVAICYGKY